MGLALLAAPATAQDRTARLLGELADAHGPSGFEEPVRKIVVRELAPLTDSIRYEKKDRRSCSMPIWTRWAAWCAASPRAGC
ncbi:hypothetical protein [Polymorphobacter multimanifer]|uniref:hypothetical protein n=1 Tax=Polymorphobacter multimanifer TaxID=1070431 RepID=UPI001FB0CEF2|nr:hypothetical protein [Polymorphobacter multimanifer]